MKTRPKLMKENSHSLLQLSSDASSAEIYSHPELANSLLIIAAKAVRGSASSEEMQSAIHQVLNGGIYDDDLLLVILADQVFEEVFPIFRKALEKLGIPFPSRQESIFILVNQSMHEIIEKRSSPRASVYQLLKQVNPDEWNEENIPLINYCRDYENADDLLAIGMFAHPSLEEIDQQIEEQAQKWCASLKKI
jgi:hypothetical protein